MEKVLLRRVQEYNPEIIRNIITEGMEELGIEKGTRENITIKPNVVLAHHKLAPSAFTRPEFLDGLLGSLHPIQEPGSKITITEKSGTGLPTSRMFRRAGYRCLKKQHRIKLLPDQVGIIEGHIQDAKEKGAHILVGREKVRLETTG